MQPNDDSSPGRAESRSAPDPLTMITPPLRPGDRVTVRHRLPDGSATDVVGWLARVEPDVIMVEPVEPVGSDGTAPVVIARRTIIVGRRVPAARGGPDPQRFSAEELQRIALPGWIDHSEALGDWVLRDAAGFSRRANSCLAVGDPGTELDRALAAVTDFYRSRSLPALVQVITDDPLAGELDRAGWRPGGPDTELLVIKLTTLIDAMDAGPTDAGAVELTDQPSAAWWQALLAQRGLPRLDEGARRVVTGTAPIAFASIAGDTGIHRAASLPSAIGRGHVSTDWCGVSAVWTHPARRRQGLATSIMAGLAGWAARRGARYVYLQVERDNVAAQQTYRRSGFRRHHGYRYLRPPG